MKTKTFILIFIVLLRGSQDGQGQQVSKIDAEASYKKLLGELKDLEDTHDKCRRELQAEKREHFQMPEKIAKLEDELF